MMFHNEETKEDFLFKGTALHVCCHFVDFIAAKYYVQAEIYRVVEDGALIKLDTKCIKTTVAICEWVNSLWKRKDGQDVCYYFDITSRLIKCRINSIEDLENLM